MRLTIKPRRQMTVQFSGGEPTISPIFLESVAYARADRLLQRAGGHQRHPLRAGAGVRDRGREGRPSHRLPAVRRRRRGRQRAPQGRQPVRRQAARDRESPSRRHRHRARRHDRADRSTTIRSDRSSSSRSRTATRSASSRSSRCRSPGATRTSTIDTRAARRYTLSHLAEDMKTQTGATEPLRDWFPLSAAARCPTSRISSQVPARTGAR